MRLKIISLIVPILLLGLFVSEANACVPIFEYAKNLYAIKTTVNQKSLKEINSKHLNNEIINGDWWVVIEGEIYSNKSLQGDLDLDEKLNNKRDETGIYAGINPGYVSIVIEESYECDGKDKDFCLSAVIDGLKEIKNTNFTNLKDKDIESIERVAKANNIITKVGFFQLGFLKIPPVNWTSYYDANCIDINEANPSIVLLGEIIFVGTPAINYIITFLTLLIVISLILFLARNKIIRNKKK